MIKKNISLFIIGLISCLVGSVAIAQPLENSDIDKYIASMEIIKNTSDPVLKSLEDQLDQTNWTTFPVDEKGQVNIVRYGYDKATNELKNVISKMAKDAGFSSASNWASVSDRITASYMKLKINEEGSEIPELTPEMLQYMPETMRVQVERSMQMLEAAKKAPQQDVNVVESNFERLNKAIEDFQP